MQNFKHHTSGSNFNERLGNLLLLTVAILTGLPTVAALLHAAVKVF